MKRRGTKNDSGGTPYFNSLLPDSDLLMLVNCILSLKNEQNQLFAIPLIP